uniref:AB hydrolase-1 domain-containing protein n=1 Tax=Echeneis naucrates TaxID=173247 RepID=A0A665W7S5_ECHNA
MIPVLQEECVKEAQVRGITLPSDWSVRSLLEAVREAMVDVQPSVLRTAACLRRSGIRTAVLANHWLDDSAAGDHMGCLLSQLGGHFDLVLQSCRSGLRVPEAAMFSSALQQLGAVWLGADEEGVKAAQAVGMKTILVDGLDRALDQLAAFTGVQVEVSAASCGPDEVSHGYVSIRPGVRTHYVEMGSGPPVLLCHGFPESWFSWRHQIPALAAAGFRVLALDMKGYGGSTAPPDVEEYSQEQLCKVTLVGHDWGGALVWNLAKYFPERVRAVASLNTPLFPIDPSAPPGEKLKDVAIFDYQVYFQQPVSPKASGSPPRPLGFICINTYCCVTGGLLVGLPEQIPRTSMLTEAELQFYVSQYKQTGFRNPLNWYRNSEADWRWMCSRPAAKLLMPALMVTAGKDPVLLPAFSKGMENLIPNLSRGHIEECGHWIQMEKPEETNNILISWLKETHEGWRHRWGS